MNLNYKRHKYFLYRLKGTRQRLLSYLHKIGRFEHVSNYPLDWNSTDGSLKKKFFNRLGADGFQRRKQK